MTPQRPGATEVERMIDVFLHDVRSPIGVAQGYAHLLSGDRLTPDDRVRALKGVSDALVRMSALVDDVAAWTALHFDHPAAPASIPAVRLCERLRSHAALAHLRESGLTAGARVRAGFSVDALSGAIVTILGHAAAHAATDTLLISADAEHLRIEVLDATAAPAPMVACDPWSTGTLEYLVAHRRVTALGGAVWCRPDAAQAVAITFPLENQ